MRANGQVGSNPRSGGKEPISTWETDPVLVSEAFPQTEEPRTENPKNRDKLAASPRYRPETQSESIIENITEGIIDSILDNSHTLEAERHRQKVALGARVTS